jgi:hypothetical protein
MMSVAAVLRHPGGLSFDFGARLGLRMMTPNGAPPIFLMTT